MISAKDLKQIFSNGVELDLQTAVRKIKSIAGKTVSAEELGQYLEDECANGVLRKRISIKDPNAFTELSSFDSAKLLETFIKSRNPFENKATGVQYSADEVIRQPYYRLVNPEYVYKGLERIKSFTEVQGIIFGCDTVSFSKDLSEEQVTHYRNLTEIISDQLNHHEVNPKNTIGIPTGDGYFVIFKDLQATKVMDFVVGLQAAIISKNLRLPLRIGIHSGAVYEILHSSDRCNVIGHALNTCARIMSFGEEKHILCSEQFYKQFIEKSGLENNFTLMGECSDKHGYKYIVYNFAKDKYGKKERPLNAHGV